MRMTIERRGITGDFRICVADSTIEIYQPKVLRPEAMSERRWIWDGTEYSLAQLPTGRAWYYRWGIYSKRLSIASGEMVYPRFRLTFGLAAFGYIAWKVGDEAINEEPGYCWSILRRANGRRLAVWRNRRRALIVCPDGKPSDLQPIIVGMVLVRLMSFD